MAWVSNTNHATSVNLLMPPFNYPLNFGNPKHKGTTIVTSITLSLFLSVSLSLSLSFSGNISLSLWQHLSLSVSLCGNITLATEIKMEWTWVIWACHIPWERVFNAEIYRKQNEEDSTHPACNKKEISIILYEHNLWAIFVSYIL